MSQNKVPMRMPTNLMGGSSDASNTFPNKCVLPLPSSTGHSRIIPQLTDPVVLPSEFDPSMNDNDFIALLKSMQLAIPTVLNAPDRLFLSPIFIPQNIISKNQTAEVSLRLIVRFFASSTLESYLATVTMYAGLYKANDMNVPEKFISASEISAHFNSGISENHGVLFETGALPILESPGLYWLAYQIDLGEYEETLTIYGLGYGTQSSTCLGNEAGRPPYIDGFNLDKTDPYYGFDKFEKDADWDNIQFGTKGSLEFMLEISN